MNKTYRLRDLHINQKDMQLLNEISENLGFKNTDIARMLLHKSLIEIKAQGLEDYQLAIIGRRKAKKR